MIIHKKTKTKNYHIRRNKNCAFVHTTRIIYTLCGSKRIYIYFTMALIGLLFFFVVIVCFAV